MKKFVAREGGILFLRSVPSGLITGCAAGYLMVPDGFQITHMLQTAALVFMVLYVITMISVHKPAQIAAAVSPVEALRYLPQDTMAQTENKKFCRSLTPAGLGIINFSKNRKKTAVTMLSLSLGGILYISAASYISSFDRIIFHHILFYLKLIVSSVANLIVFLIVILVVLDSYYFIYL